MHTILMLHVSRGLSRHQGCPRRGITDALGRGENVLSTYARAASELAAART